MPKRVETLWTHDRRESRRSLSCQWPAADSASGDWVKLSSKDRQALRARLVGLVGCLDSRGVHK